MLNDVTRLRKRKTAFYEETFSFEIFLKPIRLAKFLMSNTGATLAVL